jgi:hypothetical protein
MIATWILYCSLCALGLTLAATLAERLLLAGRAPVRVVWIGAILLSLGIPITVFQFSSSTPAAALAPLEVVAPSGGRATILLDLNVAQPGPARVGTTPGTGGWTSVAADRLRELDSPLMIAWAVLSAALAVSFFTGVAGLAWMRRRWEERVVQGIPVYVSRRTGPAIVGVMSPAIVVPEWALSLPPDQLSLMLRHECEHLAARDGQLLIAAQIALIAMPWNVALWWQVLSLRVAIEMDCDARVLRIADARSYGELLLEVARPHRSFKLAGMIAFAERASQLERRIRFLKRHRVAPSKRTTIAAATIALVAVSAAWVAPHPTVATRNASIISLPTAAPLAAVTMDDARLLESLAMPAPRVTAVAKRTAGLLTRTRTLGCANDTSVVGSTYRFLYDGVKLTRDNESKACELLARLVDEQLAEDAVAQATELQVRAQRMTMQAQRNASLAALLKTDADRATFAANFNRMANATAGTVGRGRMSGAGPAQSFIVPDGGVGGGMRGAARGARGSIVADSLILATPAQDELRTKLELRAAQLARAGGRANMLMRTTNDSGVVNTVTSVSIDSLPSDPEKRANMLREMESVLSKLSQTVTYDNLFNGITLTGDDGELARKIIGDAQMQMNAIAPSIRPATRLRVNHERGIARVVTGADTTLIDLAPSADRATVRARIVSVPQ